MRQQPKNAFESHLQKAKIAYLPKNISILDIGCGDGSVFEGTDYQVDGVDIDEEALYECSKVPNYSRISKSVDDFDVSSYDCVTLLGVLEHMEWDDITVLLDKLAEAKSIYITVPNAQSFHRTIGRFHGIIPSAFHLSEQDINIGHKRYFDSMSLVSMLMMFIKDNNFDVKKIGTAGFKFDTSLSMIPYLGRIKAIEKTALINNLIGERKYCGAELFLYLTKKNG